MSRRFSTARFAALIVGLSVFTAQVHAQDNAPAQPGTSPQATQTEDPAPPALLVKPYVQRLMPDGITVMWETPAAFAGEVRYGQGERLDNIAREDRPRKIHEVRITGLQADTHYRAAPIVEGEPGPTVAFKTAIRRTRPFTFLVYGDSRLAAFGRHMHKRVADAMARYDADAEFTLHTGDFVWNGRDYPRWKKEYFDPAAALLRRQVVFPVIGNHERNAPWYYKYFAVDAERENSYAFTYGDARFFIFDSNQPYVPGSPQYRWLEAELKSSTARWKFVSSHAPALSSGFLAEEKLLEHIHPLCVKYGVDLYLAGHDHQWERSLKDNLMHVVTGGGGAEINPFRQAKKNPWSQYFRGKLHYTRIHLDGDLCSVEAVDTDGEVMDAFDIAHTASGREYRILMNKPQQVTDSAESDDEF